MTGYVASFQHLSVNDGPGIRTIAFLKGCPLKCAWCHNPEMQSEKPEVAYSPDQCLSCGACVAVCPQNCHGITSHGHVLNRENCIQCGRCAESCPSALEIKGQRMTVEEVIQNLLSDRVFYESSGGGVTISGGEPLMQGVFTKHILQKCKAAGVHTCVETSGFGAWRHLAGLVPVTDLFLFDWKITDKEEHKKWTGISNTLIQKNLLHLNAVGAKIRLRCPIIPGVNDNDAHFAGIADLANNLDGIERVEIMPYHDIYKAKAAAFGRDCVDVFSVPTRDMVNNWLEMIRSLTGKEVIEG